MNFNSSNKGAKGCIGSACSYMLHNKMLILRRSYVAAIFSTIALTFLISLLLPDENLRREAAAHPFMAQGCLTLAILFFVVSFVWYLSRLLGCITGNYAILFKRGLISSLLVAIVLLSVLWGGDMLLLGLKKVIGTHSMLFRIGFELVKLLFVLLYVILLLPFSYSMMRYIHEKEFSAGSIFTRFYVEGFKHKGFILLVVFILALICFVVLAIGFMPGIILVLEYLTHAEGQLMGDPNGLPHNFPYLLYSTLIVLLFIGQYVLGFCCYTVYFVYLSIKKRTDEKAKAAIYRS